MKKSPLYVEFETKDFIIMAIIFGVADYFLAAVVCLTLSWLSARNDRKQEEQSEADGE
jgi:hypothetical protein